MSVKRKTLFCELTKIARAHAARRQVRNQFSPDRLERKRRDREFNRRLVSLIAEFSDIDDEIC